MTSSEWLQWLWLALGASFAVAMLWLATWALFSDRPRGRLRCPHCWYDLTHSFTLTCSECGHTAVNASQLMRRRRRWFPAALAITALTTGGLSLIVHTERGGWARLAPTSALILAVPLANDANSLLHRELRTRWNNSEMSESQLLRLLDRCAEGDWWARPTSQTWADKYGSIAQSWAKIIVPGSRPAERLLRMPARVRLTTPPAWPADCRPTMQIQLETWWPQAVDTRIVLTPRSPAGPPTILCRTETRAMPGSVALPLPPLDASTTQVIIDVVVQRKLAGTSEDWQPAGQETFTLPVRLLGPDEPAPLAPLAGSPEMDAIMSRVFRGMVVKWASGASPVRIRHDPRQTDDMLFDNVVIGVIVEIVRDDGAVARRLRLWWPGGAEGFDRRQGYGWEIPDEDQDLLALVNGDDGRWSMRVRGDLATACRVGSGRAYWSGELTMPLIVMQSPGQAPPPLWWIQP